MKTPLRSRPWGALLTLAVLLAPVILHAQQPRMTGAAAKSPPDLANHAYGPHPRHVLDLWKAKSDRPTPLVVYIHGGGFRSGSKESLSPGLLRGLLDAGISVMAINYRLSPEVHFPAHYLDCARAIQYARQHAREWNIHPERIGATGGSAGAGTSLWLGFHEDLADRTSSDPVLRQSTRLAALAVHGAQSSYDPRDIRAWVGEAAAQHPALLGEGGFFGIREDEADTPKAHARYREASAINFLTADDPPVIAFYSEPRGPLPPDARPGTGIHHIHFGLKLKERMDALGLECTVRHRDEGANPDAESVAFFVRHLKPGR
jgi:acetyl esterase/lipase